jgi:hypothetical protein
LILLSLTTPPVYTTTIAICPFRLAYYFTIAMPVQLKPEIYKMIVESMLATNGPPDFKTKLDQQQTLARMMRASKVDP